ncbi:sugar phosphate isomerase/epimerase [bacterium]|nr:sugar phosphate isomerase/epimerase [bacterium]
MKWPIIMHVNYCEQGQTIPEMCHKAVEWGYDGIEFRGTHPTMSSEEYLDAIESAVKSSGLKKVLFGGPSVTDFEEAMKFYKIANEKFNLTVCNMAVGRIPGGSAVASSDDWKKGVEDLKLCAKIATEVGFKFALEIHMGYLHDLPESTMRLLDMLNDPAVGANLDYGNIVYLEDTITIEDSISIVSEKLYYVHLKNSYKLPFGRVATGLADGAINHRDYLKALKKYNYKGLLCIEAPRPGDREWFAREDIAYLKTLIEEI